jgi:hypothetical protein
MVPARQRGQILILLAGWLFFGGGASSALVVYDRPASEMKKTIKRVITDVDRRDAILSALSQWKSAQKKQDKKVKADRKDLFKILGRQSSQRSEVEPIMARLDDRFVGMDQNFLDFRFRVKEQVSSAEWAQIVARPER